MMHRYLTLAALLACVPAAHAQTASLPMPDPTHICTLPFSPGDANHFVPAKTYAPGKQAAAVITVNYINGGEAWPAEAITAFEYAADIWEQTLSSTVPILVDATWGDVGGCSGGAFTLGSAGPTTVTRDWGSAPEANTWYPIALANAIAGVDLSPANNDINATLNAACDDPGIDRWYFGTDANPPSGQVDFVSVVLHELGHGLGFTGQASYTEGDTGTDADDTATLLLSGFPVVYSRNTEDGTGTALASYTQGSNALALALEGEAGGVFFDDTAARGANGGAPVELYAPAEWEGGSSYSHLDEATFNLTDHALMTPQLSPAEAVHQIGAVTCGMFEDMGWTISDPNCNTQGLPVELAAFEAQVDGSTVHLAWQTLSETAHAGFGVERGAAAGWQELAFVPARAPEGFGSDYTHAVHALAPGTHRFRLALRGTDGTVEYSPVVEAGVDLPDAFALSAPYPNPFNPSTRFTLAVRESQDVRVDVYDALGRRVATLHDGPFSAGAAHAFTLDASGLAGGMYAFRAVGERFHAVQTATLVK